MGLIAKLLGSTSLPKAESGPRPIPEIEKSLALVVDQRSTAQRAVDEAMRKRSDQLLVDGSDDRIAELDAEADRLRLVVERCDAAEPILVAELAGARDRRRREQWRGLQDVLFARSRNYLTQMHSAKAAFDAMVDARSEAIDAGFGAEVAAMFPVPVHVLAVDLINQFERGLERAESMASQPRKPAPTAAPPAPRPHPKKPDDVEVEFLEPPVAVMGGRPPGRPGEVKRVSPDVAARLVRHGFAKYVGKAPETAPRPENAEASK